jgi:hypothetical protein
MGAGGAIGRRVNSIEPHRLRVTTLSASVRAPRGGQEGNKALKPPLTEMRAHPADPTETASRLMAAFVQRTGLGGSERPQRYLWSDAFAVCAFLELYRRRGDEEQLSLALRLVDQVHQILGRHRDDDPREGWISGLDEEEGARHPTRGGLRIGKPLNERRPPQRVDPRLEWERDGQYFHYLTRWMHALNRVFHVTGERKYLLWALELAHTAHTHFTYVPRGGGRKRIYWKLSVDLTYPLVPTMGQHDPLDGLVTFTELQAAAASHREPGWPDLTEAIAEMALILAGSRHLTSDDPLAIGGLLIDSFRLAELIAAGATTRADLLEYVVGKAGLSLTAFSRSKALAEPVPYRLPFRELGLALGLHAVEALEPLIREGTGPIPDEDPALMAGLDELVVHVALKDEILSAWLDPENTGGPNWNGYWPINTVMLATALIPDGYLTTVEPQPA